MFGKVKRWFSSQPAPQRAEAQRADWCMVSPEDDDDDDPDVNRRARTADLSPHDAYLAEVKETYEGNIEVATARMDQALSVGTVGYWINVANQTGLRTALAKYEFYGEVPTKEEVLSAFVVASKGYQDQYGGDDTEGYGLGTLRDWAENLWCFLREEDGLAGHADQEPDWALFSDAWNTAKAGHQPDHLSDAGFYFALHTNYVLLLSAYQRGELQEAIDIAGKVMEMAVVINSNAAFSVRLHYALIWDFTGQEHLEIAHAMFNLLSDRPGEVSLFQLLTGEISLSDLPDRRGAYLAQAKYWAGMRARLLGDRSSADALFQETVETRADANAETLAARIELGLPLCAL